MKGGSKSFTKQDTPSSARASVVTTKWNDTKFVYVLDWKFGWSEILTSINKYEELKNRKYIARFAVLNKYNKLDKLINK